MLCCHGTNTKVSAMTRSRRGERAPSSVLVTTSKALVTRSDALVPSSVLAPS